MSNQPDDHASGLTKWPRKSFLPRINRAGHTLIVKHQPQMTDNRKDQVKNYLKQSCPPRINRGNPVSIKGM
jgi:hypothetical protein